MASILTERFVFFDSIAETMNVPPDHTFGACLRPEEYGKYINFLLNKQTKSPQSYAGNSMYPSLKASNFKGLKYYITVNENNL